MVRTRIALAASATSLLAALVLAASASAASVSVGHAGWTWGNPRPQGNDLNALAFASGGPGYAVGNFGTLLKTGDGGATWSGLSTGTTADLSLVQTIGSSGLVVGGGCSVRRSDDGGATFRRLPFSASERRCGESITGLAFPSTDTGFLLLSDGTVLRTPDGGKSFQRRTAIPGTAATGSGAAGATDISFVSDNVGIATAHSADDQTGFVYRTLDGGGSWTLVATATGGLSAARFVSASVAYAVGDNGALLRSADGGATWTAHQVTVSGNPESLRSLDCTGTDTCLFTTAGGGRLIRTLDGGTTISAVSPSSRGVFGVGFATAGRAVAVGAVGTTVVSDDAGSTFSAIGDSLPTTYFRLRAGVPGSAFAIGGEGSLVRTTNAGASWSDVGVSTAEDLADVSFPSADRGFALDVTGGLFRTDNAGSSWSLLDIGAPVKPRGVLAATANTVLLVGPKGVRRSTDGGDAFDQVTSKAIKGKSLFDYDRAPKLVYVYGGHTAARSSNNGRTWSAVKLPRLSRLRDSVARLDFTDKKHGWLLTGAGRVYRQTNGKSWARVRSFGPGRVVELAMATKKTGFVSLQSGPFAVPLIMRTDDGGLSWAPELLTSSEVGPGGLLATGPKSGYVEAGGSQLLSTAVGGRAGTPSKITLSTKKKTLRKAATITVSGKLTPPEGAERVAVSMLNSSSGAWKTQTVQVATNGRFSTAWKVTGTRSFVAQWTGDDERAGDASTPLTVSIKKKHRKHRR